MTSLEAASLSVPPNTMSTSSSSTSSLATTKTTIATTENQIMMMQIAKKTNVNQSEDNKKNENIPTTVMTSTSTSANTTTQTTSSKPNNNPLTDFAQETLTCSGNRNSNNIWKTPPPLTATRIPQLQQSTATIQQLATSATIVTATTPQQRKLQHDHHQPYPLTTPPHANNNTATYPFRRSASLRLRGSKSNLLFDINAGAGNGQSNVTGGNANGGSNPNSEHASGNKSNVNTRITKQAAVLGAVAGTKEHDQCGGTHERFKAGQLALATRRKFVPNTAPTQTAAISLTRSLSSRRSYPNNLASKTDAKRDNRASVEATAAAIGAGAGEPLAIDRTEIGNTNGAVHDKGTLNDCAHLLEQDQLTLVRNCVASNGDVTTRAAEYDIMDGAADRKNSRDVQKMSLNLNGATTTSKATSPVTARVATAAVTGSGAVNVINKSTATTPKTPSQLPPHHYHHHHHNHQHCNSTAKYVKSSPTATHETKLTPRTPPVTPDSPCTYLDDDLDSMYSFATTTSGRSTMSCEHPYVARNGTTFSGRKMKYVVHCSNYAGQVGPDYLTPTQRAARQIRRLKELLCLARQDLEQKDSEILRLTREVVELRLFKASLSSPEERSASSDAVTVREAELKTSQDVSPIVDMVDDATKSSPRHIASLHQQHLQHQHLQHSQQLSSEMQSSFADSGHFEDLTTSSVHSKDSYAAHTQDIACGSDEAIGGAGDVAAGGDGAADAATDLANIKSYELQRQELIRMYEAKIEELIRTQDGASSEMKRSHNDKVEALLQKLAECNTRYADIVPNYEHAKERIRELEKQLEDLQRKLSEHEEKQNKMYLHMYQKGQEAERIARADQALELAHRAPNNKVSINELLHQLQNTQDELENIRAAECRNECGSNHALLTAKEAISLWVLGARKTIYRRLLEAQKNRTHVDPEVTLQFLKSAIYYFLTDKENSQGHLQAIESILEFTEAERQNINKARVPK